MMPLHPVVANCIKRFSWLPLEKATEFRSRRLRDASLFHVQKPTVRRALAVATPSPPSLAGRMHPGVSCRGRARQGRTTRALWRFR